MGSFNVACSLTNDVIQGGDEVVMLLLTTKKQRGTPVYSWDFWAPIPILFQGKYDTYYNLDDISIYQSKNLVSDSSSALETIFEDLKNKTTADRTGYLTKLNTFTDLFQGRDFSLIKKDSLSEILGSLLSTYRLAGKDFKDEALFTHFFEILNVKTIDELENKYKEIKNKQISIPISFMMFKREAFTKLVNQYGLNDEDSEHYSSILQKLRQKDFVRKKTDTLLEADHFLNGTKDYAGSNRPAYSYNEVLNTDIVKNDKKLFNDLNTLKLLHVIDLSLVNDYFSVLGKIWQPSMTVSEDIKSYGHNEAYAMQQELLSAMKVNKKLKI